MGDKKFVAATGDNAAENWIIASFGMDQDGKEYFVTSYYMKSDEIACYSEGAKADAELVAKLLNLYFKGDFRSDMMKAAMKLEDYFNPDDVEKESTKNIMMKRQQALLPFKIKDDMKNARNTKDATAGHET